MFHMFAFNRDDFLAHYHKRSNVQTAFSMIKRKFGDSVRAKQDVSQANEVLLKILAHNLVVLVH
jgi:transposase